MKSICIVAAIIISVSCAFSQSSDDPKDSLSQSMRVDDVIALVKSGVSDSIIYDQIRASHAYFDLNTDDILDLKKSGVSEYLIDAMIATQYQETEDSHQHVYHYYAAPYGWYPSFSFGYWGYYPWFARAPRYFGHYGGAHFGGGFRFGGGRRAVGGHR